MSSEEAANGKKSYWAELEISGKTCKHKFMVWKLRYGRKLSFLMPVHKRNNLFLPVLIYLRSMKAQWKEHASSQSLKPIHCCFTHYQCPL